MDYTTEELKKVGFSHIYKPLLKKVDETCLDYGYLYRGELITIDLFYLNGWKVGSVSFSGNETFELLKKEMVECSIESVVEFVKKYPSQTF